MNKKIKFEVTCYLQGYGSWKIKVEHGSWLLQDRIYTISVVSGIEGSVDISHKTYRFPSESTVLIENK